MTTNDSAGTRTGPETALTTVARGAGIILVGLILGSLTSYIIKIILAKVLGADEYGLYSLGLMIFGISATVSVIGLSSSIPRYIAFFTTHRDTHGRDSNIAHGSYIVLFMSIVICIVVFIAADVLARDVFSTPELGGILRFFAFIIPLEALTIYLNSVIRGVKIAKYRVITQDLGRPVLLFLLILIFFALGLSLQLVLALYLTSSAVMLFLTLYVTFRKAIPDFQHHGFSMATLRALIGFSLPLFLTQMLLLVVTWTDTATIGIFYPAEAVGIYNVAVPTVYFISVLTDAFNFLFMPSVTELFAAGKKRELQLTYSNITRWAFTTTLPIFLFFVIFSGPVCTTVFGSVYYAAAMPLAILAFGKLTYILSGPSGTLLIALGKTRSVLAYSALTAGLNVVLNILFIPSWGINGAALATMISLASGAVVCLVLVHNAIGFLPSFRLFGRATLAGVVSIGPGIVLFRLFPFLNSWLLLAFSGILLLLIYPVLVVAFKTLTPDDLNVVRGLEDMLHLERRLLSRFLSRGVSTQR